ncbi:nitroreductase [Pseudoflavonifractor sp. 524-17]|uniref:nitroreductase family protein n=1 Tax=Pseudoflavonifractor sp. 524-17 TaxID=2304577 RepID=UPI00137A288C|nr:nitroreductase [Pseudoflavonifractor sp. 524-17]NCE65335.1 nitroreductase [Pseudoflavonifractor sp. 524-17]
MDLQTCIHTRRSIRTFTSDPVSRDTLEEAVSLAAWAPSWKNTQISRYLAIQDPEALHTICEQYAPFNARVIGGCHTLVAQTFVKNRSGFERDGSFSTDRERGWQYYDCGIAAQTFCLAAHALGLGTVILGIFDRKGLEQYLNLPEDQELMALIAVGYPAGTPAPPKRKDVETLLSFR